MGKRSSIDTSGAAAFRKRQKIVHDVPTGEDVTDGDELRKLLTFDQDMRRARHGLQSLKRVLSGILANGEDRLAKLTILRQYLELVKPRDTSEDAVFLNDIMEMWSFAVQVNDDGVMSSAAVVLELTLRVASNLLDLVKYGLGICQTLLQERQLKSISRNLSSEKGKGFVLSPTLRMLQEVVCLDGGAFARRVVRARAHTFSSLGRNLEIGHVGEVGTSPEDLKKSSVRTNAVRFFLSCLKYLHSDGRRELLSQKELLSHLTFMIKSDPPQLVCDILDSLKNHVLADSKIPRELKFKSFNTKTLMRFLALYSYSHPLEAEGDEDRVPVSDKAHQFLLYACTTPGAGILYPSTGLYPKESSDEEFRVGSAKERSRSNGTNTNTTTTTTTTTTKDDRLRAEVPVFNFVLSEFAEKLRPWASLKHSRLLTAIFAAAPELIADYFFHNRSFSFEPKLSMTWIGYAAFLFDSMRIPLPSSFGDKTQYASSPPPTPILLDNILPLPISQKTLVRCLTSKSNLTSFFATRIMVEALEKLARALEMHGEGFRASDARWKAASRRLIDTFCQRIPDMKEVVRCYKEIPRENGIHKTMASRLLRLYYEVIPQVALAANFDVSPFFVHVLQSLRQEGNDEQSKELGMLELENLVSIASYSPGMRWFSKIELAGGSSTSSSPFTELLRLSYNYSGDRGSAPLDQLREVLADVAVENQFVSPGTRLTPLLRALQSVVDEAGSAGLDGVWPFLDNCITRCGSSPLKYLGLLETYLKDRKDKAEEVAVAGAGDLNLLAVAVAEQLPYFTESASKPAKKVMARFISSYLQAMTAYSGRDALKCIHGKIQEHLASHSVKLGKLSKEKKERKERKDKSARTKDSDDDDDESMKDADHEELRDGDDDDDDDDDVIDQDTEKTASKLELALHVPFSLDEEDTSVLVKWHTKPVEDLVEDDWAARLIRLLASPHTHIRREALTNTLKMAAKFKESSYEEKDQIWLLLSELAESAKPLLLLPLLLPPADEGEKHSSAGGLHPDRSQTNPEPSRTNPNPTETNPNPRSPFFPSQLLAFATHALDVLKSPLHPLYPKINTFLTRSPIWPPDKLPLAHDILHGEPSEDDKYYAELAWFLTYALDALRTPRDVGVFHAKRWFEKILALGANPYLRANLRLRVLRIVYRATCIEGGSTTLVTRFGLLSWLDAQRAGCRVAEDAEMYAGLMRRVWETCERRRVLAWSKGGVEKLVQGL